jgi:pimeloyl-ACP methyl ester carboxylesterase
MLSAQSMDPPQARNARPGAPARPRPSLVSVESRFVSVEGMRTHYFEGGSGPTVVLLHSGEFGGCAELSWEYTFDALTQHFHVLAPDWLGYGQSAKVFSFDDMWALRVRHIREFLKVLCVERAHFIGNSLGGTILAAEAAAPSPAWPIERVIVISGGGYMPENEARQTLNSYDGSREHMRGILKAMFVASELWTDEVYLDRRHAISLERGAWECTAAARFRGPGHVSKLPPEPSYANIPFPTLIIAGKQDALRNDDYGPSLQAAIPKSELLMVDDAGHCPHIDQPAIVNVAILDFLGREGFRSRHMDR